MGDGRSDTDARLRYARARCEEALAELADELFLDHCRLTLVMRNPEVPDGDMVITDDELDAVEKTLQRFRRKEDSDHG